jgi:hypothetical protein
MIYFSNFLIYFSLYIKHVFRYFFSGMWGKYENLVMLLIFLFLIVGWSPIFSSKPIHSYSLCASLLCALPVTDIYIYALSCNRVVCLSYHFANPTIKYVLKFAAPALLSLCVLFLCEYCLLWYAEWRW